VKSEAQGREPITEQEFAAMRRRFSLLMFLNYAVQGAFVPLFSLRLKELSFTPLEIGWACATQAMAGLVGPLMAGQIADRYVPAQRCLALCALVAAVLLWLLAGLTTPWAVFVMSLILWLVLGPCNTLCAALSFAHLASAERDFGPVRLWGTIGWAAAGWGFGLWLWLGVTSNPADPFADIFYLAGLLAFALAAYALTLPHTPPQKRTHSWFAPLTAFRLLRSRAFLVYWTCSFGVCITLPFFMQLAPLLLRHLGVPGALVGPTMTLGQSMEVIALALLPMLLLRLGIRGTMFVGLLAWGLLMTILMLGEPLWLVVSSLSLNGLCICGFIVAGQVFVNSRAHGHVRASAQALLAFINSLGLVTGNILVGCVRDLVDEEFAPTFAVAAVIALGMMILFVFEFYEDRSKGMGT
jgi:MFS family permease